MDSHDWRAQLLPHIRQREVDKISNNLKFYQFRDGGDDELLEVQKIAQSFEQKTYAGAASQEDYLQKISSMMQLLSDNWRAQLGPDSRQRIVQKIMETLKRHLPFSGREGLLEIRKIAQRFEEKIYTAATSQPDYLRKISLKMLTMETKSQNNMNNPMPTNAGGPSNQPPDAGRHSRRKRKQPEWLADFVTYR